MKCVPILVLICVQFLFVECALYIVNRDMSRMIQIMSQIPFCYIFTDRDYIKSVVNTAEGDVIQYNSEKDIYDIEKGCSEKLGSSYQGGFIYPGTKWCGPGAIAQNFSDLGNHKLEDMCCREHDQCNRYIERGQCKGKLCNMTPFTRSHCECDDKFKQCLQDTHSETGNTIGAIFFNVAQVICFRPKTSCNRETEECELEFTLSARYVPSEIVHYYRTKGEVVEKYVNRFLKRLNFL